MKKYEGAKLRDLRSLTMNQILLLNHASSINHERGEEYYEWKKKFDKPEQAKAQYNADEMPSEAFLGAMLG